MNNHPKNLKALNKYIQKEIRSTLQIVKGKGYFYLYSDDKEESLFLCSIHQTGIYVNNINDLTFERWYQCVITLLSND